MLWSSGNSPGFPYMTTVLFIVTNIHFHYSGLLSGSAILKLEISGSTEGETSEV